jgi:hypothetical protein
MQVPRYDKAVAAVIAPAAEHDSALRERPGEILPDLVEGSPAGILHKLNARDTAGNRPAIKLLHLLRADNLHLCSLPAT